MARPPRVHFPGALSHVMTRGNGGARIFEYVEEWESLLDVLRELKARLGFELYAYCLMPNHLHFLMRVFEVPLSIIMQRLLTTHSKRFNAPRERVGHVFQGRYKSKLCMDDAYCMELLAYVHLNPVRAGLVARPEDWKWSGHGELAGSRPPDLIDPDFPLRLFDPDAGKAREKYVAFLAGGAVGLRPAPPVAAPTGSGGLRAAPAHAIEGLAAGLLAGSGYDLEAVRRHSRVPPLPELRMRIALEAQRAGHPLSAIGDFLDMTPQGVAKSLRRATLLV